MNKEKKTQTHHRLHFSVLPCWEIMIVRIPVPLLLLLRLFLDGVGQDGYFGHYRPCAANPMVIVVDGILIPCLKRHQQQQQKRRQHLQE